MESSALAGPLLSVACYNGRTWSLVVRETVWRRERSIPKRSPVLDGCYRVSRGHRHVWINRSAATLSLPAVGRYPQQSGALRCQRSTHWEQAKAIRPRRRWSLALEERARFPEVDVKVDASIGHDLASASGCCGSQKVPTGRQPHALGHRVQARCGTPPRTGEG